MADFSSLEGALAYRGSHPSIADIMPVVMKSWGVEGPAPQVRAQREHLESYLNLEQEAQVLVVLIDGLGYELIMDHLPYASFLRSRRADILEGCTVLPSTTAAAITAFGTGLLPGLTRMVGWSVKDGQEVTSLITFEGATATPEQWQPNPTLFEKAREAGTASFAVMPAKFAGSGLTRAALRGTTHVGAETFDDRITAAIQKLREGAPVVYLYWSDLDHDGHGEGVDSNAWLAQFEIVDSALARIARELPKGASAIVTGDHGMVNTSKATRVDVAQYPPLQQGLEIIAGEGRAVHIHAKDGAKELLDRWERALGERATIVRGVEENARVLGGEPGARLVGHATAYMHGNWVAVDSRTQPQGMVNLKGVHGSFSHAELSIPILRFA
ncbi:MAG: alkaline phosphatase family protein [Actinomycetaceae bacterium]|nr:alkaline phosphatase family protein [Actinomycetaceae bacterium]